MNQPVWHCNHGDCMFTDGRSPRMGAPPSRNKRAQRSRKQAARSFNEYPSQLPLVKHTTIAINTDEWAEMWFSQIFKVAFVHINSLHPKVLIKRKQLAFNSLQPMLVGLPLLVMTGSYYCLNTLDVFGHSKTDKLQIKHCTHFSQIEKILLQAKVHVRKSKLTFLECNFTTVQWTAPLYSSHTGESPLSGSRMTFMSESVYVCVQSRDCTRRGSCSRCKLCSSDWKRPTVRKAQEMDAWHTDSWLSELWSLSIVQVPIQSQ